MVLAVTQTHTLQYTSVSVTRAHKILKASERTNETGKRVRERAEKDSLAPDAAAVLFLCMRCERAANAAIAYS